MTLQTVTTDWADGAHTFRLRFGELIELDKALDRGPLELLQDLMRGAWRPKQMREIIRLGLVGGGMPPAQALGLVRRYVEERPLLESVPLAMRIMEAALYAPLESGADVGEQTAGETPNLGASTPPNSTATALQ